MGEVRHTAGARAGGDALGQRLQQAFAFDGENFLRRALRYDAAVFEADDIRIEQKSFVDIMRNGERWNFALGEPCLHPWKKLIAEFAIEAGEGLVQEHEAAVGDGEGAGQSDAATLTSRELGRHSVGQAVQLEELEHVVDQGRIFRWGLADLRREADVIPCTEVREKRSVLRCVSQGAEVGWSLSEALPGD